MRYEQIEQCSPEWWALKVGKVSGTRFGQLISCRENMLVDELASEIMDGFIQQDEFVTDAMQFGIDNEPIAIDLYEKKSGIIFDRGGVIFSEFSDIHMASPDGISKCRKKVIEVKCTMDGKIHLNRFRKGIDSKYLPQVINYFATDNEIEEVHFVSYCPFRPERELVEVVVKRDTILETKVLKSGTTITTIQNKVDEGRSKLIELEKEVNELINNFKF